MHLTIRSLIFELKDMWYAGNQSDKMTVIMLAGAAIVFLLLYLLMCYSAIRRGVIYLIELLKSESATYESDVCVQEVGKPIKADNTYIYLCKVTYNDMQTEKMKKVYIEEEVLRSGNGPYLTLPSYIKDGKIIICSDVPKPILIKKTITNLVFALFVLFFVSFFVF